MISTITTTVYLMAARAVYEDIDSDPTVLRTVTNGMEAIAQILAPYPGLAGVYSHMLVRLSAVELTAQLLRGVASPT